MLKTVKDLLCRAGIALAAPLSLSACRIVKPYLLERAGITSGTAFLFAVPYYTTECEDPARNISAYAVSDDYHLFFSTLFNTILPQLQASFPSNKFVGFTDHSPIAEVDAACKAGLGVLGCHRLLITKPYSSFVFLGEIITDAVLDAPAQPIRTCPQCGACQKHCPVGSDPTSCLSALTQKKGVLSESERASLLSHQTAWGCDLCQKACPFTAQAKKEGLLYTNIPFFKETALPHLSTSAVQAMTEEEFSARAYSWRGRAVIARNLELLEKGE